MMMGKVLVLLWTSATLVISAMPEDSLKSDMFIKMDKRNMTLENIPTANSSNIIKLLLNHNCIMMNSLDIKALSLYPNLTELDLSYNQIASLPGEAFLNLSSLDSLILKGNDLQTVKNETFTGLGKLRRLDLGKNPWNCTCLFVSLMKWMNDTGVQIDPGYAICMSAEGPDAVCAAPENLIGRSILDVTSACSTKTTTTTTTPAPPPAISTACTSGQRTTHVETNKSVNHYNSNKDSLAAGNRSGQQEPVVSNTWTFLAGVVVIALCTSMFIVCAIKFPSWYKLLFNYRHQRLREVDEPSSFNFSLDTEQTETRAQELDQDPEILPPEDEDGFIEDGYIQPEDYKHHDDIDKV